MVRNGLRLRRLMPEAAMESRQRRGALEEQVDL